MAMHPVRLDERHRGGDTADQGLVERRGRCGRFALRRGLGRRGRFGSGGRCRCGRRGRRGVPVAAIERRQQPEQTGMRSDELAVAALEERAPLGRDSVRILEVLIEQQPGVAGVQAVDVVCAHICVVATMPGDPPGVG